MKKSSIFITSFHPLILRNIFSTSLPERLQAHGINPVVLVFRSKEQFFREELRGRAEVAGVEERLGWRDFWLRSFALASLKTRSLAIKRRTELRGLGARFAPLISGTWFSRVATRTLSRFFTGRDPFFELLKEHNPKLVFSSDIQNEYDVRLCRAARDRGIPVIGMVRSWDNLTSKGLVQIVPDLFLVQNEIQAREAKEFHGIPEENIRIIGIPHYDHYIKEKRSDRKLFFHRIGADPTRPLLLFAPVGDRYIASNTVDRDVLQILDQVLPPSYQILVRYPPDDQVSFLQGKYRQSEGRIFFDKPRGRQEYAGTNEELNRENDMHLADTLYWSDTVVCGPSTICVDAAFFDKPIVLFGFDGYEERPYFKSVRRYFDYDHWQPVLKSGGVCLAKSPKEFEECVGEYVKNPAKDHEGRKRVVEEQCGKTDGKAMERLASALLSHL